MRRRLGRVLGINAQVTTPGGLGFRCGPFGVGFRPGVGRGYPHDMAEPHCPRVLATPPQPPHHTPFKLALGLGCPIFHVSHHAPNPRPTIPHDLRSNFG
ncbi:hypothetical protein Hanom_Chr07g00586851 [Helianthus anomalus]